MGKNKEEIFFSIIVPVYNVEKYVYACLDSILSQTYRHYEVICINDASTDNSYKILYNFANKHEHVKIINNIVNGGLSYSRNRGIKEARGDYILFVDSDDYIEKKTLEILANNLRKSPVDFLNFNYDLKIESAYEAERNLRVSRIPKKVSPSKSGQSWFKEALEESSLITMAWSRVYRRKFLKENYIYFYDRLLHEDILFLFQAVLKAKTVASIDDCLYFYRKREGSITSIKSETRLDSLIVILSETLFLLRSSELEEGMEEAFYRYLSGSWIPLLRTFMMSFPMHKKLDRGNPDAQFLFRILQSLCISRSLSYIHLNQEELKRIRAFDKRIIYGAGNVCAELLVYFEDKDIHVHAVAVSNKEINTQQIAGYSIRQIDELLEDKENALVIVAIIKRNQEPVRRKLIDLGFKNILLLDTDRT